MAKKATGRLGGTRRGQVVIKSDETRVRGGSFLAGKIGRVEVGPHTVIVGARHDERVGGTIVVNKKLHELYNLPLQDKIGVIKAGISKQQLTDIKTEIEVDYDELSEVLGTSRATLIKKKKSQKFDPQVSERIVMLNDVLCYGREVFGDSENFTEWLKTPSEALGNVSPLSMMDTLYGIDEVKKEIGRIAYGVY